MRKFITILLCCLLLAGCTVVKENNEQIAQLNPSASPQAVSSGELKASLYFLDADGRKLAMELRPIVPGSGQNPAEAVLSELIRGPVQADLKKVVPGNSELERVEVSDGVADVYARGTENIPDRDIFAFKAAVADTLADFLDISYVNVFWNGVEKGIGGLPAGPQAKLTGDVDDAWQKAQEAVGSQNTQPYEGRAILYFAAKDGGYILPEIRNISYTGSGSADTLLSELIAGPEDTYRHGAVFKRDTQLKGTEIVYENSQKTLLVRFAALDRPSELGDAESEFLRYACIVYTLTGAMPDIAAVKISIGDQPVEAVGNVSFAGGMRRAQFDDALGKSVTLYLPLKDSTLLTGVNRTIMQSAQWNAMSRLAELFKGPRQNDAVSAWPIVPAGLSEKDIISVTQNGDLITVDLSDNFRQTCARLSKENEVLLIYGIVNTLTEVSGVKQVRFTVQGREIERLAGYLYLKQPLIRNPGIIKKNP